MGLPQYKPRPWHRSAVLVTLVLGAGVSLALIALAFRTPDTSSGSSPDVGFTEETPLSLEALMSTGSRSARGVTGIQGGSAVCDGSAMSHARCSGPLSNGVVGPTASQEPAASAFAIAEPARSFAGSSAGLVDAAQADGRIAPQARMAPDSNTSLAPNARRSAAGSQGLNGVGAAPASGGAAPSASPTGNLEVVAGANSTARLAADGRTSLAPDDATTSATGDIPTPSATGAAGQGSQGSQGGQGGSGGPGGSGGDSSGPSASATAANSQTGVPGEPTAKGNETSTPSGGSDPNTPGIVASGLDLPGEIGLPDLNPAGFGEAFGTSLPADALPGETGDSVPSAQAIEFSEQQAPVEAVPVPEPAALVLLGSGLGLTAWQIRRQGRRRSPQ